MKTFFCYALLMIMAVMLVRGDRASAQVVGGVVSQEEAMRHGLVRSWYTQTDIDGRMGKVVASVLNEGVLFVQTSRARLQALDAETGGTLWSVTVGNERYPCYPPAASNDFVATVNGTTLYVINRAAGREEWSKQLPEVPGSGPAVTSTHVFVPMLSGRIYGYPLKDRKALPFVYMSHGRILTQPLATENTLIWTTEKGYVYLMHLTDPERLVVNFRLETNNRIEARPGYWTPYMYGVSLDGYVYAVNETNGQISWKFSTAEAILEPPAAVEGKVYVSVENGGMYCLNGTTGVSEWFSPGIGQFLSVTPSRVYVTDRLNRLVILDAKTGQRLSAFAIPGVAKKMRNLSTDRIYMATEGSVVQCLHEADLVKPLQYIPPPLDDAKTRAAKLKKLKEGEADDAVADEPAAEEADEEEAVMDEDDPFGAVEEDMPAEEEAPAEEEFDDPFG